MKIKSKKYNTVDRITDAHAWRVAYQSYRTQLCQERLLEFPLTLFISEATLLRISAKNSSAVTEEARLLTGTGYCKMKIIYFY